MSEKIKRIVVVRHGQSTADVDPNITDESAIVLTELGIKQSEATGRYLKECGAFNFTGIYASNAARAVETAAIIRRTMECAIPVHQLPDLREQDAPEFDAETRKQLGRKFLDEVRRQFPKADLSKRATQAVTFPDIQKKAEVEAGAEPVGLMQSRLRKVLDRIAKESDGDAVVVSHSKLIDTLVYMFTGIFVNIVRPSIQGYNNCAISIVEVRADGTMSLIFPPSSQHLDGLIERE